MNTTHRIKPGHGYWDATNYPIGGCFRRAPKDGDGVAVEVQGIPQRTQYGNLVKFIDGDNRTLWADERAFEPVEEETKAQAQYRMLRI